MLRTEKSALARLSCLVPTNRPSELGLRLAAQVSEGCHVFRIVSSIWRLASGQGTSVTVPASITATRRLISAAQAASTSSSASPPKLAINVAANSARSSVLSRSASANTLFAAAVTQKTLRRRLSPHERIERPGITPVGVFGGGRGGRSSAGEDPSEKGHAALGVCSWFLQPRTSRTYLTVGPTVTRYSR